MYAFEIVVSICNPYFNWLRVTVRIITPRETMQHIAHPSKSKEAKTTFYLVFATEHKFFFKARPAPLFSSVRLWLQYFERFFSR